MSTVPPTTPRSQTPDPVTCTPPPNTTPPLSPSFSASTGVDATYQIVRIKHTNTNWFMPGPSDRVQIIGSVFSGDNALFGDEEAAAEEEAVAEEEEDDDDDDNGFEIPCAAHLTWGGRSIYLNCLYYTTSAALFTDVVECADEAGRISSVEITMQDVIFCAEERGDEMVEDEDVRDDNGNPFLVLHVNRGFGASARLYCKKVPNTQNGLTDGFFKDLGLNKRWRDGRWGGCCRTNSSEDDCT